MKNSIPVLILSMIMSLPIYSQTDPTPKAVFSSEQQTLTFYYDTLDHAADNVIVYETNNGHNEPGWQDNSKSIKTIIFDPSFAEARPTSAYYWFDTYADEIIGLEYLNTSEMTDMSFMFIESKFTTLDLSSFNTANVTDMSYMFLGCDRLTSLDLSNWNTERVTTMEMMFYSCKALPSLDLSGFRTPSVNNFINMFLGCISLASIDVSNFDFTSSPSTAGMFYGCESLTSIDMSNWDTGNVVNMNHMFDGCYSLTSIDLSNFDTHNVRHMNSMFDGCVSLTSLDLSNFNTENLLSMNAMFSSCYSLTSLDLSNLNTSNVLVMADMFWDCINLTTLNLSNFKTPKVEDVSRMFSNCYKLTTLDLSGFESDHISVVDEMFAECNNLRTIITDRNFQVVDLRGPNMFLNCYNLVGGEGTSYENYHVNETGFAHIDGTPFDPYYEYRLGFFTDKDSVVRLFDDGENIVSIASDYNRPNVLLSKRTFYRDNTWNTLCVPFAVDLADENSPLHGAIVLEFNPDSSYFDSSTGELSLSFSVPMTDTLEAGKPYIFRWEDDDDELIDIGNPFFKGVDIHQVDPASITLKGANDEPLITFTGTYSHQTFPSDNRSLLFIGSDESLYTPSESAEIGACRAYFRLADHLIPDDPSAPNPITSLLLNIPAQYSSIYTTHPDRTSPNIYHTLDGRILLNKPTLPGLYIHNGRKLYIK